MFLLKIHTCRIWKTFGRVFSKLKHRLYICNVFLSNCLDAVLDIWRNKSSPVWHFTSTSNQLLFILLQPDLFHSSIYWLTVWTPYCTSVVSCHVSKNTCDQRPFKCTFFSFTCTLATWLHPLLLTPALCCPNTFDVQTLFSPRACVKTHVAVFIISK